MNFPVIVNRTSKIFAQPFVIYYMTNSASDLGICHIIDDKWSVALQREVYERSCSFK
jgi:hypothetical protein